MCCGSCVLLRVRVYVWGVVFGVFFVVGVLICWLFFCVALFVLSCLVCLACVGKACCIDTTTNKQNNATRWLFWLVRCVCCLFFFVCVISFLLCYCGLCLGLCSMLFVFVVRCFLGGLLLLVGWLLLVVVGLAWTKTPQQHVVDVLM